MLDAMRLYEQAIRRRVPMASSTMRRSPTSCASRFYRARGFDRSPMLYLRNARYGYLRWGADGKVRQLDGDVSTSQAWKRPRQARRARSRRRSNASTSRP